jgi:predicted transcriptional regulator of viral defense system
MKYLELQGKIKTNVFTFSDLVKYFEGEDDGALKTQLHRFIKKELVYQIKRGIYCFNPKKVDQFELASYLYQPSYISLESALHYHGMIPDIPQIVTCITPVTTKKIKTPFGKYYYSKIKQDLFFGYQSVASLIAHYQIAKKEKALLDFIYIRKIKSLDELRLNLKEIDKKILGKYIKSYPERVAGALL